MFHTKDGAKAIKRFRKVGGGMAVSACETFIVADTEELFNMGFEDAYQSTTIAIAWATENWSLEVLNEELVAAGHASHDNIADARKAIEAMLLEGWVD